MEEVEEGTAEESVDGQGLLEGEETFRDEHVGKEEGLEGGGVKGSHERWEDIDRVLA